MRETDRKHATTKLDEDIVIQDFFKDIAETQPEPVHAGGERHHFRHSAEAGDESHARKREQTQVD